MLGSLIALFCSQSILQVAMCQAQQLSRQTPPTTTAAIRSASTLANEADDAHTTSRFEEKFKFTQCLVIAPETYAISSQESGLIREIQVEENSHVTPDQVLLSLDADVLNLETSVAQLQYQVAKSEANDDSDILFADMVVEEAKLMLDAYEDMGKKREASSLEVRQKRIAWEQAKLRAIQARSAGSQKLLKSKLAGATLELTRKKADSLILKSPVHGQVTKIEHRRGEWVSAGKTILHVVRLDKLRVDFFIDLQNNNPEEFVGRQAEVVFEQSRETFKRNRIFAAQIVGYSPEVSSTGRVRVSALVENRRHGNSWGLLPGMNVSLQSKPPVSQE